MVCIDKHRPLWRAERPRVSTDPGPVALTTPASSCLWDDAHRPAPATSTLCPSPPHPAASHTISCGHCCDGAGAEVQAPCPGAGSQPVAAGTWPLCPECYRVAEVSPGPWHRHWAAPHTLLTALTGGFHLTPAGCGAEGRGLGPVPPPKKKVSAIHQGGFSGTE